MRTFQDIVDTLARRSGFFSELKVQLLLSRWSEVVPEPLASHSHPLTLRGGVLHVYCEDGLWASEMRFFSGELVQRMNQQLGGLRTIQSLRITQRSGAIGDV